MKWYHWLIVPLVVAVVVIAYVLGRRETDIATSVATEIDVIESRAEVKRRLNKEGTDKARAWAEERYYDKLERLDADGKAEADRLRNDPVALTEWLARIGR